MSFFLDLANNRTSVLVQSQLPEFITNNYPLFVAFIESYYEYLEQNGKLTNAAKNIPNYLDIDYVVENDLTAFIELFREMYLVNIPTNILADKAKLLKHIKTFYSSRGTTKSFKFLFRALFNEDVDTFNTGSQILKLSDGKWYQPQTIRIVTANAASLWENTQIFGQTSYSSAIVETATITNVLGVSYLELTLSNITKTFLPSETIYANTATGQFLVGDILGIIPGINIINPGSKYNIGDPVIITGGGGANAQAEITAVSNGSLTDFSVIYGGSGYAPTYIANITSPYQPTWNIATTSGVNPPALGTIVSVDNTGVLAPAGYMLNNDLITTAITANVVINQNNYINFYTAAQNTAVINANSRMSDAFSYFNYLCGPILLTKLISGGQQFSGQANISIQEGAPAILNSIPTTGNTGWPVLGANQRGMIAAYGAIGRFTIINGGINYSVGDDIVVTNFISRGFGAFGRVQTVNANGTILTTLVALPSIAGFANVASGSNVVIGQNTLFTTQLTANNNATVPGSGTYIVINNEQHRVANIINNQQLTVSTNFTATANIKVIRLSGYMLGGYGYLQSDFPSGVSVSVRSTSNGSGAIITPTGILGTDAILTPVGQPYGQIKQIEMIDFGDHYTSEPNIDLTHSGDGKATANAVIIAGQFQYPGYYLNEDGQLSSRRFLQDAAIYNNYTYNIISRALVTAYYKLIYQILNPAGANMRGITQIPISTGLQDVTAIAGIYIYTVGSSALDLNFILDVSTLS